MVRYFALTSDKHLDLSTVSTRANLEHLSNTKHAELLQTNRSTLEEFQIRLYAGHAKSMLIVFQGMDTAGILWSERLAAQIVKLSF